jgi:hypothetical protein
VQARTPPPIPSCPLIIWIYTTCCLIYIVCWIEWVSVKCQPACLSLRLSIFFLRVNGGKAPHLSLISLI